LKLKIKVSSRKAIEKPEKSIQLQFLLGQEVGDGVLVFGDWSDSFRKGLEFSKRVDALIQQQILDTFLTSFFWQQADSQAFAICEKHVINKINNMYRIDFKLII
jgi:hypothetical protein